jgi:hypothetical protein
VKQEPSAFDHDRGAEAVAIKYLHVRVESQARPWRRGQPALASAHGVVIRAGLQVAEEELEGDLRREGRREVKRRQKALNELVKAIREFRKFTDQPLTLRGSEYAHAGQELNKAIDLAEKLVQN